MSDTLGAARTEVPELYDIYMIRKLIQLLWISPTAQGSPKPSQSLGPEYCSNSLKRYKNRGPWTTLIRRMGQNCS